MARDTVYSQEAYGDGWTAPEMDYERRLEIEEARRALDKIKDNVLWWDNAQDPISWLLEKKVSMGAGYSGRIFRAAVPVEASA